MQLSGYQAALLMTSLSIANGDLQKLALSQTCATNVVVPYKLMSNY